MPCRRPLEGWRADELEEYLNNGYTHPRVRILLMRLRNGDFGSWAATIHDALVAVWGLGRRMTAMSPGTARATPATRATPGAGQSPGTRATR